MAVIESSGLSQYKEKNVLKNQLSHKIFEMNGLAPGWKGTKGKKTTTFISAPKGPLGDREVSFQITS